MSTRGPLPIGDLVRTLLARLGVGDLETWHRIEADWDELAGEPWRGRSRPRSLQSGVLVIEASTPAAVSILRYGVASLRAHLERELGEGVVRDIQVRPPSRRGG